ncbi:MAG: RNA polymerase sigma factor, partial [Planctomycetota bacterium]
MTERDWTGLDADEALPLLLDEYGGVLYGLGLRFCGNPADAEDLVQQTFLQAWRAWDGFDGRSSPGTWLHTIASRVCGRFRRKKSGEPRTVGSLESLLPFGESAMADLPGPDETPL